MKKNNRFLLLQLAMWLVLSAGCHLDYKKAQTEEELSETIPETILLNITLTKVKHSRITSILEADKVETYKNKNVMEVEKLHYTELNDQGEPQTEGWADKSTYTRDTENAEISGNVYFYSQTEKTGIRTESLSWDNEQKILTSPPANIVTVIKDDGSYIEGSGFVTNFKLKEITFSGRVNGVYVDEDDDEAQE